MKFFRKNWHLIISGLLGILMFLAIFGIEPLRYTGIGWTQHGYGGHDITQQGEFEKVLEEGTMFNLCPELVLDAIEILDEMIQ